MKRIYISHIYAYDTVKKGIEKTLKVYQTISNEKGLGCVLL